MLLKIRKFHRETPVSESLCNKKETPTQVFSCEIYEIFKNAFFTEHLRWLLLELQRRM